MSEQSQPVQTPTRAQLRESMRAAYERMEDFLRPLSAEQLSRPDPAGWGLKHHLAHLADWEAAAASLIEGQGFFAPFGLRKEDLQGISLDQVNDLINERIFRSNRDISAEAAVEKFRAAHHRMLRGLDGLEEADLSRSFDSFETQPLMPGPDPVWGALASNSYEHMNEHLGWMQERLRVP